MVSGRVWLLGLFLGWLSTGAVLACTDGDEAPGGAGTDGQDGGKDSSDNQGGSSGTGGGGPAGGPSAGGGSGGDSGGSGSSGAGGDDGAGGGGAPESSKYLLKGTIVVPDTVFDGQVLVKGDLVVCVKPGNECELDAEAEGARVIDTNGIIAPGLIDSHNHILFDIFDTRHWSPNIPKTCETVEDCKASPNCGRTRCACVEGSCKYINHNQWPKEPEYGAMIDYKQCLEDASQGKPVWCPNQFDGQGSLRCEMNKYGELKGLIAGTTSIVGLTGQGKRCYASLARSIDVKHNGMDHDHIQTSVGFPPAKETATAVCENFTSGKTKAYLIHCGEGVDEASRKEFDTLGLRTEPEGCLYAPQTAITHGTAFTKVEYDKMAAAGMKLIWSPASNVSLYGSTNDLKLALDARVTIALAPDWSMGGSRNMLEEMRFAQKWDDEKLGNLLTAKDIVSMATVNAAAAIGYANDLGRLAPGYKADLFVIDGDRSKPYEAIVAAWPSTVKLVMVGGYVLYGDESFADMANVGVPCERRDVCGNRKFLCVATEQRSSKLGQTLADIETNLNTGLQVLDAVEALPLKDCEHMNPDDGKEVKCSETEKCFKRITMPQVEVGLCGGSCPEGFLCYERAKTGDNRYACLFPNACQPSVDKKFHPITELFACP